MDGVRGWFRMMPGRVASGRWNLVVWILAVAAGAAIAATGAALSVNVAGVPLIAALLFALLQGAAIPFALIAPTGSSVVAVIAAVALTALAPPTTSAPWPVSVTTIIALCLTWITVGARTRWFVPVSAWVLTVIGTLIVVDTARSGFDEGASIADLVVFASTTLAAVAIGILLRNWTAVRAQLTAERAQSAAELARREAVEDKARIARELHDVVAHGMSAIQIRAASARYRLADLPPEAAAEFDDLAATARASMAEMRTILGLLRDEESAAERAPQPTLADVDALIERARDLGPVAVTGAWPLTDAERADRTLGLVVYRVVQEALSNVARHAHGAATAIMWHATDADLAVEIRNGAPTGPAGAPHADGGGQGLRGMRERVQALGGTVTTTSTDDGGFRVRVLLPRRSRATDPTEELP